MQWKKLLSYVTGSVDQELLLRNEYLVTENRILRNQIQGRLRLSDSERVCLAAIGKRLGRRALAAVAQIVRPETILAWHRKLIARKFDGSKKRLGAPNAAGRQEIEELVLQVAQANKRWGYRRIVGALNNLGHQVSHQTVANILKRVGVGPAPEREKTTTWREFIRSHLEVLAAVDFFTVEVWTRAGLMTYYVLVFMRVASRKVCIAGITTSPDTHWMQQMARNVSHAEVGFLTGCSYLLHDRDAKFCAGFDTILQSVGLQAVRLPARSPNLNPYVERLIGSIRRECLDQMIVFNQVQLHRALQSYFDYYHKARPHRSLGHDSPVPRPVQPPDQGRVVEIPLIGGLHHQYLRQAA